jgi:hypothetical protein
MESENSSRQRASLLDKIDRRRITRDRGSPFGSRLAATKIASFILRPERLFLDLTSFQSRRRPTLSFGSSSFISLRRESLSLSRARLRPPGNIHSPSRFLLTSSTRPRLAATSFEDFAIRTTMSLSIESPPHSIHKSCKTNVKGGPQLAGHCHSAFR